MRWSAVLVIGLAACGGTATNDAVSTVPSPDVAPPTSVVTTSTDVDQVTTIEPPSTSMEVVDGGGSDAASDLILAIEPALLPDDAFPAPWEPQWRTTGNIAYGAGGNQTDCAPYWTLESLRGGRGGGHAMWWVDGANANHYVSRLDEPVGGRLLELATLAADCPVVNWLEGGTFTVESVPVNDGLGFRLVDRASQETTWIGLTTYGDLLSVIDVPMWAPITSGVPVEFGTADLDRLVTQMSKLLRASPVLPSVPTTTLPGTRPQNTQVPDTTTPIDTTTTIETTIETTTTTTVPIPADLEALLLDESDLPPGFRAEGISINEVEDEDDELLVTCPASASIGILDEIFRIEASWVDDDRQEIGQFIGRADSAERVVAVVEQFAEVAACDLSDSFGGDTQTSGGAIDIAGADAAARLTFVSDDEIFAGELVVLAVGDVASVVSVATTGDRLDPELAPTVAARAVERIIAGSTG